MISEISGYITTEEKDRFREFLADSSQIPWKVQGKVQCLTLLPDGSRCRQGAYGKHQYCYYHLKKMRGQIK